MLVLPPIGVPAREEGGQLGRKHQLLSTLMHVPISALHMHTRQRTKYTYARNNYNHPGNQKHYLDGSIAPCLQPLRTRHLPPVRISVLPTELVTTSGACEQLRLGSAASAHQHAALAAFSQGCILFHPCELLILSQQGAHRIAFTREQLVHSTVGE